MFSSEYKCCHNSDDKNDPELALTSRRALGGVLVFWKINHDPYITLVSVNSIRFCIFIYNHPDYPLTIHAAVYLPNAGLETGFVEELSKLEVTLDELSNKHPEATVFIRGDANACCNPRKGNKRDALFKFFCNTNYFSSSMISHPTYHHFVGNTSSSIDVILQNNTKVTQQEVVIEVLCSQS